jgi:Caspase domain
MSGQRKALIIANDTYEQEALQNLQAPAADAEALGRVLGEPQIGDFAVHVARNEPAHIIQAQIEEVFSEARPDDVLLLHFSGHGLKSESGELFFAASNTRPNRLGSTAVPADFVQRCMRDSRSRSVVLLLDCCYGGAFSQGVQVRAAGDVNVLDSFPQGRSGGGRGRAVITASSAMEYAFEGDQLGDNQQRRPSVFTSALVEGLATGDADRDEDGWVSLDELYDYVFDKVRQQNPHQTPSRRMELEGELYLARSRRRRIRPAPIPADLQAALADPNMYTRLGAITELRSRLASDNLPAAAGAYEALAELTRTATRYLAEPAAEALSEAAVQPSQTELHFGRIERGSPPPHQIIRLLGPPIARACLPRPTDDWIHVDQVAEGLDISIDTAGTGTSRGSIDLKGPTGEAVIAVDIDLISPPPQTPTSRRPSRPAYQGLMAVPSPKDVGGRASPVSDLPGTDSEQSRPQPGQRSAEHRPETVKAPGAEAAQDAKSARDEPTSGQTQPPAASQHGLARETTAGVPARRSSAPLVWAAGSAVLGVLLFLGALPHFIATTKPESTAGMRF